MWKHGQHSAEAVADRAEIREILRGAKALIRSVDVQRPLKEEPGIQEGD